MLDPSTEDRPRRYPEHYLGQPPSRSSLRRMAEDANHFQLNENSETSYASKEFTEDEKDSYAAKNYSEVKNDLQGNNIPFDCTGTDQNTAL